jgi:hypothetical protein
MSILQHLRLQRSIWGYHCRYHRWSRGGLNLQNRESERHINRSFGRGYAEDSRRIARPGHLAALPQDRKFQSALLVETDEQACTGGTSHAPARLESRAVGAYHCQAAAERAKSAFYATSTHPSETQLGRSRFISVIGSPSGISFGVAGTITPLVDLWLEEGRLPNHMRPMPKVPLQLSYREDLERRSRSP